MRQEEPILNWLLDLFNNEPSIALGVFILSFVANLIQVGSYFTERWKSKQEAAERARLNEIVDNYESVVKVARETVEDKERLAALKEEIRQSSTKATELASNIEVLQKAAQKKIISQAIEYNLDLIEQSYTEVQRLRQEYKDVGDLPEVSRENKEAIEKEVQLATSKPYSLPKDFVFNGSLLVLLVLLLPRPVNALLLPFLIRYIIITAFEAIWLHQNRNLKKIVIKYYSILIFLAEFGVWAGFINVFSSISNRVLISIIGVNIFPSLLSNNSFTITLTMLVAFIPFMIALLLAIRDWRYLVQEIKSNSIPKIKSSLQGSSQLI